LVFSLHPFVLQRRKTKKNEDNYKLTSDSYIANTRKSREICYCCMAANRYIVLFYRLKKVVFILMLSGTNVCLVYCTLRVCRLLALPIWRLCDQVDLSLILSVCLQSLSVCKSLCMDLLESLGSVLRRFHFGW